MPWLDTILASLLVLWTLGVLFFNLPLRGLNRPLDKMNGSRLFSRWSLFSPANATIRPGIFEVHFRDRVGKATDPNWQLGACGSCWAWRAFFWLPERFVAAAVQNLGREIRSCFGQRPPLTALGMERARVLEALIERRHPRVGTAPREFRVVRRFASDGTMEKVLEFPGRSHGAGR